MTFSSDIPDIARYNSEMEKGMLDKIFFADIIDADVIVDYGCANGAMLAKLNQMYPNKTYIGYDINETEINLAQKKYFNKYKNMNFYSDWSDLQSFLEDLIKLNAKTAVVCSSIIHEVYHYGDQTDVQMFWDRVFGGLFDWVVMRDMCPSRTLSRTSDPISVAKIRQTYNSEMLNEFETHWGTLDSNWSLVHFLLKYRYIKNWSREVQENYLPINYETLLRKIPCTYTPVLVDHFVHPFTRMVVDRDFGIQLQDRTHVKLIFRRN